MDQESGGSRNGTTGTSWLSIVSWFGARAVSGSFPGSGQADRSGRRSDRTAFPDRANNAHLDVGERSTDEEGNRVARIRGRSCDRSRSSHVRRPWAVDCQRVEPLGGAADQPGSDGPTTPTCTRSSVLTTRTRSRSSPTTSRSRAPASGPNFPSFDDTVLYEIKIDNNGDGEDDISYQFRFTTTDAEPEHVPLQHRARSRRWATRTGTGRRPTASRSSTSRRTARSRARQDGPVVLADNVPTPPDNIGPRSTPNYDALAAAAVTTVAGRRQGLRRPA